jgi:hypothetical protein
MMLYVVRYLWPEGARFLFNAYKHWTPILYHDNISGTASPVLSKTGVIQGDPLSMYAYALTLVPLIQRLHTEFPQLLQVWYADD